MITIQNYVLPETLEEAYNILNEKRTNTILGGCAFLRMGSKRMGTAIDLSKLNLNFIKENEETIEIGGMTTFREVETSPILENYFDGVLQKSVKNIVGVQFRNVVTVGATVYSRYGFSDFLTALLSLDVQVVLHKAGSMSLEEFLEKGSPKDLLTKIIIPKTDRKADYQTMRNSESDYAILNVAVSKRDQDWKVVVGARPQRAKMAKATSLYLSKSHLTEADIEHASILAADELTFGRNMRASKEYRKHICSVLVKRAILEVI